MVIYELHRILPPAIKSTWLSFAFRAISPITKKHFSQFIKPGSLVFDVGANIGMYTELFLGLGARVVAIDPLPYSIKVLKRKFRNNSKVSIVEKGLSDHNGATSFYISKNAPDNSTFYKHWLKHPRLAKSKWEKKLKVPVTTLNDLIAEHGVPDFCKIDVEGYELQVLKGLRTQIPAISYEFDQEFLDLAHECSKYLTSLGDLKFNYTKYLPATFNAKKWLSFEQLVQELEEKKNGYLRGDVYAKFI